MAELQDLLLAQELSPEEVSRLLEPYSFTNPHNIDAALQRMCPGPAERIALAEHLDVFLSAAARSADPEQCLLQLDRLAESHGQRATLYRSLGSDPQWVYVVFSVIGCSRALSDVLVLNPEYLDILADSESLLNPRTLDDLRLEASRVTSVFQSKDAALNALRRMRRREYLRIGAREFTGLGNFTDVVREISDLACALVGETLSVCHESLNYPGEDKPDRFAVIAFGKLGARELNYSSDIDLALVWDTPPDDQYDQMTTFYQKLSQSLVEALSALSPEGRMYRVDLRLRPFGKSGPIGSSIAQFLNYYESWSEPWERQALIKARAIAGPPDLCATVNSFIQEFTFARPMDSVSTASILNLKERSENFRSKSGHMDRQVKHGWGGIRDIEFTVQLLQLVAGAKSESLRTPATLEALEALVDEGVLSSQEEAILSSAYVFLRQVEHRLQLAEELPMQMLPEDHEKLHSLALRMGYRDEPESPAHEAFLADYQRDTQAVRDIHNNLFREFLSTVPDVAVDLADMLEGEEADIESVAEAGFKKPEEAIRMLRQIVRGSSGASITSEPQRRFLQMLPDLLHCIGKSPDPDLSLSQLQKMAEATGSPLSFFRSIESNPKTLEVFTRLAASSEFISMALIRHPEYIDMLAQPAALSSSRTLRALEQDLLDRVNVETSEEGRLNALRRFRLREFLRIGVRDVSGLARVTTTTREISLLAEACIRVAFEIASGELDGKPTLPGKLSILGMGKLGGRELHYSSDVDLVCVYEEDPGTDGFKQFERCVKSILDILSRLTSEGRGFHVDLRLRPEGKGGMLALSLAGYKRYLKESLGVWERQAIVRARVAAGHRRLGLRLVREMQDAVWGQPLTSDDLDQLRHIKKRIENERSKSSSKLIDLKLGPGGILDIEFTVQMIQLAYGGLHADLRKPSTMQALKAIQKAGILPHEETKILQNAYVFLRKAENRLQLLHERPAEGVSTDPDELATFARRLGYSQERDQNAAEAFLNDLKKHTEPARLIHERVFFEQNLVRDAWKTPDSV